MTTNAIGGSLRTKGDGNDGAPSVDDIHGQDRTTWHLYLYFLVDYRSLRLTSAIGSAFQGNLTFSSVPALVRHLAGTSYILAERPVEGLRDIQGLGVQD